ncbi:MAG TPA: tubulin-like doman-containing protein [Longimicrobium sp.]|nr:tubulin-like doman-containing protein [Longimicrobium sp.]
MTKLHPSIVIGLGESGADIVRQVAELVGSLDQADLTALTRTLTLTAQGLHGLDAGGEPNGPEGIELALDGEARPGVWSANYQALVAESGRIKQRVERAVYEVRSFSRGVGIERRSIQVGSDVTVYLVASLADPVGSAGLIPMLANIHDLFGRSLQGMHARVQLVLLSHDLLPEGPGATPLLKARAYASMQELEFAFDGRLGLTYPIRADLVWLLSSRNEENLFLGGYAQLVPVIAHQMLVMLRGEVLADLSSVQHTLADVTMERARRYSTFGFSQLSFPREQLLARATDGMVARTLAELPVLAERRIGAGELSGEVERFVYAAGFNEVLAALGKDDRENEIWTVYNPGPRVLDEEDAQSLLHALRKYDSEYERVHAPEMQRRIGARRTALLARQQQEIYGYATREILEQRERGTLAEVEAWLAALVGEKSEWVHGDVALGTETLYVVDRDLDRYFEPLLFGKDEDDRDSAEYVARIHMADGRRRLLQQVKRQLDEKVAVLLHRRETQEQRRQALEAAAAAAPEAGRGEGAAAAGAADAAGAKEDVPQAAAAAEPPAGPAGVVEEPAPAASWQERTAATTWHILTQAELTSDERYIADLEKEVEALTPMYARLHGEVTRLDHTIQNASERRRIFIRRLEVLQKEAHTSSDSFLEADLAYRKRRAELEEWADRRRRWLWMCTFAWTAGLVLATVLLVLYPGLRQAPWWAYTAVLVLAAAGTAVRYWTGVGRTYRDLQEKTRAARVQRDMRRDHLVQAYLQVRREIYEYDRYDALVDWRTELAEYVRTLRRQVREFRDELQRLARDSAQSAERLELPDSPFLEHLLPPGGVQGLLERHAEEMQMQMREMWRHTPPTAVFEEFRSATGSDRLQGLRARIRQRAETVFADFREVTAEQYFAQAVPSEPERRIRVNRLYRNAAPFAKRVSHDGGETAERLVFVGLTDAPEQSVVRASLEVAKSAQFYVSESPTEVSILRVALAFPAFHFAPMEEARSDLEGLGADVRPHVYVDPSWLGEIQDLKPSVLRLGGPDDEFRRLACLAVAYGCAEDLHTPDGGRIRYAGVEFPNYEAWVLHLGGLAGRSDRRRLQEELGAIRARSTTELPAPAEMLRAYRDAHPALDPVDREIIETEMSSFPVPET